MAEQPRAFRLEAVAAEAEDLEGAGHARAEVADEIGGVEVAGRLTAGDQEPRHPRAVYRWRRASRSVTDV